MNILYLLTISIIVQEPGTHLDIDTIIGRFNQNIYVVIDDNFVSQSLETDQIACFQSGKQYSYPARPKPCLESTSCFGNYYYSFSCYSNSSSNDPVSIVYLNQGEDYQLKIHDIGVNDYLSNNSNTLVFPPGFSMTNISNSLTTKWSLHVPPPPSPPPPHHPPSAGECFDFEGSNYCVLQSNLTTREFFCYWRMCDERLPYYRPGLPGCVDSSRGCRSCSPYIQSSEIPYYNFMCPYCLFEELHVTPAFPPSPDSPPSPPPPPFEPPSPPPSRGVCIEPDGSQRCISLSNASSQTFMVYNPNCDINSTNVSFDILVNLFNEFGCNHDIRGCAFCIPYDETELGCPRCFNDYLDVHPLPPPPPPSPRASPHS